MTAVNPTILRWSRETAGFTIEDAARKIDLRDAYGETATERLESFESGAAQPSTPLLRRMAKQYRRPLVTFFLDQVPAPSEHGVDFRTIESPRSPRQEALLAALLREVHVGHGLLREALIDEDEIPVLDFVGSCSLSDGVESVLHRLQDLLSVDLEGYRSAGSVRQAFAHLRSAAEAQGVHVMLKGNLGTHHTSISVETFRGFSIADDLAPLIVINENDAYAAWSFSLLHELVHILCGQSGVSSSWGDKDVERFCDELAGEFLFPTSEVLRLQVDSRTPHEELANAFSEAANTGRISRSMVAYRAFRAGLIGQEQLQRALGQFRAEWNEQRESRRGANDDGGPSYYTVRRHRVGRLLIQTVKGLMLSGSLSTTKAAQVLGVKPQLVGKLVGIGALE